MQESMTPKGEVLVGCGVLHVVSMDEGSLVPPHHDVTALPSVVVDPTRSPLPLPAV